MATKKDLVEAYSFSRRRLVTAFVSGAPGGREVEPARPGRTIVGGVALAVLLMAGAAIAGVFSPTSSIDFDEPQFIIAKDKGSIYVVIEPRPGDTEPTLRPITNVTSAQLILGSQDFEPVYVPLEKINEEDTGPTIGILDAPATVPEPSQLIQRGWTSCTGTGLGIKTDISTDPAVTLTPDAGFVVRRGDDHFLIAEEPATATRPARAHSYAMPANNDSLNSDLQVELERDAIEVPAQWLELFPTGSSLDVEGLNLDGAGRAPDFPGSEQLGRAKIGDYYYDVNEQPLVITEDGVASFSDFAFRVLRNTEFGGKLPKRRSFETEPALEPVPAPYGAEAHWPESTLSKAQGELCAQLEPDREEQPRVLLAQAPTGEASAEEVDDPGLEEASVESGRGAFVMSAGWGESADSAEPVLVDERGRAYPLVGPETAGLLGYADDDWVLVPESWLDVLGDGVPLSRDAALCPPTTRPGEESCQ